MKKNFLIEYICFGEDGKAIKSGKMRVKNKANDFEAMASLEKHFSEKLNGFKKMIVRECKENYSIADVDDVFSNFSNFKFPWR